MTCIAYRVARLLAATRFFWHRLLRRVLSNPASLIVNNLHAQSKDAAYPSILDPQYCSNPLDLELMARQVMYLQNLASAPPLCDFLKPDGKRNHPSAHIANLEAALEYVKQTAISGWHACGMCAMLLLGRGGWVLAELLVYGTKNVRVADASIIPIIPRGNIKSTVYAVAERVADIIKASA